MGCEFSDLSLLLFIWPLFSHIWSFTKGERNRRHFLFKSISWPIDSTAAGTVHPSFRRGSVDSVSTYRLKISTSVTHCICDLGIKREPDECHFWAVSAVTYSCHSGLQHTVRKQGLWSAKNEKLWSAKNEKFGLQLRSATQESGNKTNLITLSVKKLKCG